MTALPGLTVGVKTECFAYLAAQQVWKQIIPRQHAQNDYEEKSHHFNRDLFAQGGKRSNHQITRNGYGKTGNTE